MTVGQQRKAENITKSTLEFNLATQSKFARKAIMKLPHGEVKTPVYMPVGTKGSIKGLISPQIEKTGCRLLLGNTYHLNNSPGGEFLLKNGGLRKMMGWSHNILTDSGGFQMVSLSKLCQVNEDGVKFNHPETNAEMFLRPEDSIIAQMGIGGDIIMMLDHVVSSVSSQEIQMEAMQRTIRWLQRNFDAHTSHPQQNLFPILQGGLDIDMRRECIKSMTEFDANGYAIGGLSGGEAKEEFVKIVHFCCQNLPKEKPRYLMGVGYPEELVVCIALGVDMFDCVYPTRTARFGTAFSDEGLVKLKQTQYEKDFRKLDENCDCFACQNFTWSYFNKLVGKEEVAAHYITMHNIRFLLRLMERVREAIEKNEYEEFAKDFLKKYYKEQELPNWIKKAFELAGFKE